MQKISTIVLYILALISIVLLGVFVFGPRETVAGFENVPVRFDINLIWAAILFALTVLITLFFAIEYLVTHPQALKGTAISLLAAAVLIVVGYLLASSDPIPGAKQEVSSTISKWVDVGLIVAYILGGIAIVGMIFSEIYRAFK
jgi:hypothetical protein